MKKSWLGFVALFSPASGQDLTTGLVAHYQFNGNANDSSANALHGEVHGATPTEDRRGFAGKAFSFTGTGQYISVPAASVLNDSSKVSISLWVKDLTTTQTGAILGTWNEANGGIYLNDYVGSTFAIAVLPNGQVTRASNTLVGDWHHIVIVFDGSQTTNAAKLRYYVDGASVPLSYPYPLPSKLGGGAGALLIGGRQVLGVPGNYFAGQIDDIRIYSRTLSGTEVGQIYATETGPVLKLKRAVKPAFSNLAVGTAYQLQTSADLDSWSNHGAPFTAMSATMDYPGYFDVSEAERLYFRVRVTQ